MTYIKWFLFLFSRITLLPTYFLVSLVLEFTHLDASLPQALIGFTLVLGLSSPVINFIVLFCLFILLVKGIPKPAPVWLITANLVIFVIELIDFKMLFSS